MKASKKWVSFTMVLTIFLLLLFASIVIIIDPFFHYHKPIKNLAYSLDLRYESYVNPGIVRNFEFDSLITGTSMNENFKTSWFDSLMGLKTVKVPYSGANFKNVYRIITLALSNNKELKKVFFSLDPPAFERSAYETRHPLPDYLYNDNILDDANYIFNKDIIFIKIENIMSLTRNGAKMTTFDEAFSWMEFYTFGKKSVLDTYVLPEQSDKIYPKDYFLESTKENLDENIVSLIKNNPNIEFNLYFPPFSILFWNLCIQNGTFDATIAEINYVIEQLLEYENVRLFYFQNIESVVCNFDHYKDYAHYDTDINYLIAKSFSTGEYLLTKDNYKNEIEKMIDLAKNYDYNSLLLEKEE